MSKLTQLVSILALQITDLVFGLFYGGTVRKHYPVPANVSDYRPYASIVATDALFRCGTRNASLSLSGDNHYIYYFDHPISFADFAWGSNYTECDNYTCHGGELVFLFHPNTTGYGVQYTQDEQLLSAELESYWAGMAKNGAPGAGATSSLTWPAYTNSGRQAMFFTTPSNSIIVNPFDDICNFWDLSKYPF